MRVNLIVPVCLTALLGSSPLVAAETVATVNGLKISDGMVDAIAAGRLRKDPATLTEQEREAATDQLIQLAAIATAAEKAKLDHEPEVAAQLELQRMSILAQAMMAQHLREHPVTEDQLKQAYDGRYASATREYHARHILVETPDTAAEVIAKLDGGADFAALAAEYSTGPTSRSGGDLGWFSSEQMVAPFSQAVAGMEVGSYTSTPVQTQFGWHVIRKENERETPAPDLASVREELERQLQQQQVQALLEDLRTQARIKQ